MSGSAFLPAPHVTYMYGVNTDLYIFETSLDYKRDELSRLVTTILEGLVVETSLDYKSGSLLLVFDPSRLVTTTLGKHGTVFVMLLFSCSTTVFQTWVDRFVTQYIH